MSDDEKRIINDIFEIIQLLSDVYEPYEIRTWFLSPQKLLGWETPAKMIFEGNINRIIRLVNNIKDGAYL